MSDKQSIKDTMKHLNDPTMVEKDENFRIQKQQAASKGDENAQWWVKFDQEALTKEGEVYDLNRTIRERNDGTWMRDLEANFHHAQNVRDDFRRTDRPHSTLQDKAREWDEKAQGLEEGVISSQKSLVMGVREGGPEANKAVRDQLDVRMEEQKDAVSKRQEYDLLPSERAALREKQMNTQKQGGSQDEMPGFRESGEAPGGQGSEGSDAVKRWREERQQNQEGQNSTTKHGMEGYGYSSLAEREREKRLEATHKEFQYQNDRLPSDAEVDSIWAKEDRAKEQAGQKQGSGPDAAKDGRKNEKQADSQPRIQGAMDAAVGIEKLGPMPPQERKQASNTHLAEARAKRQQNQNQSQTQVQKRGESQSQ